MEISFTTPESANMVLRKKILAINPNTSKSMTRSLEEMIKELNNVIPFSVKIHTYTAKSGPPSINNHEDALQSALEVRNELAGRVKEFDGFLVACYSLHPLVGMLREIALPNTHIIGIFEASIATALCLISAYQVPGEAKFGIVSTGKYWELALAGAVKNITGLPITEQGYRFAGVETTGLNADELHTAPAEEVEQKMKEATKRLAKDKALKVICLGCAGMVGLEGIVREALVEEMGEELAQEMHIVDGVKAGIGMLETLLRACP